MYSQRRMTKTGGENGKTNKYWNKIDEKGITTDAVMGKKIKMMRHMIRYNCLVTIAFEVVVTEKQSCRRPRNNRIFGMYRKARIVFSIFDSRKKRLLEKSLTQPIHQIVDWYIHGGRVSRGFSKKKSRDASTQF